MKKRIISLVLVVVMAVMALVSCGFSYDDDLSEYADVKFDKNSSFNTISISFGDFDHTDAAMRAKLVEDALNTALAKKADTDDKRTDKEGFDKTRDIIYYCYYAVVSEGQTDAGKVVYTNYMSSDKAVSLQVGLEAEDETLNAYIYKLIKDGHYDFSEGVYTTTTSGSVKEGATIYVSYTKTYSAVVDGQTGTATDTAVYHKLDATATGAEKIFYDKLVGKTLAYKHTASSDAIKFNFDSTNNVEMTFKDENIDGNDDATGLTQAAFDAAYPVVSYTAYTAHFACEGNLKDYSIHGVKYGTTTETTVDLYTGAAADNAKVKLTADTKLDYYIFPTHYVKTPEINATNIINLVYGSSITATTMAKVVFGEEYYTAIEEEDYTAALEALYVKYEFATDSGTLHFDEYITHVDTLQGDLESAKKEYDTEKTKFEDAKEELEEARRAEGYLELAEKVAAAKAAIEAAAGDETAKAAAQAAYDELVGNAANKKLIEDYDEALSAYYTEREVFIGERKPTADTEPGSEVIFDEHGHVVLAENYEATATADSKCGIYNKATTARDKAVADLIAKVGEDKIVYGYRFFDKYKSLESSYNSAFKKSLATALFKIVYANVTVTEAPEDLVDEIYEQLIDNFQYYYYYNIDVSTGSAMFTSSSTEEDYEAKAYYHVYGGDFERFMTEYAVATYFSVQTPADYDEALDYVKAEATRLAKERVLVFAAAEALGVKVTEDDLDEYLEEIGYSEITDEQKANFYIGYQFEVLIDELLQGFEVKSAAEANGYYATYYDFTKCEDGSASPYIKVIVNKDVAVTE